MKRTIYALLLALMPVFCYAQFNFWGRVADSDTQEPLIGASVQLLNNAVNLNSDNAALVATTDNVGSFSFSQVPAGKYQLQVSYIGYLVNKQNVAITGVTVSNVQLIKTTQQTSEVLITATRANDKTATTYTNISREDIKARNFGQDIPYILDQTPSVVVNSDAGAGVGYTGIRIRGSDISRINVTVNGIPINDPESHGTFFVNMPDLASSVQDIQIQRGVGTSTNGAAAFGASINISTLSDNTKAYAEAQNSFGSFNTWRHTVSFGSGLIKNKFNFDGRLSKISSDGYVDRAFSDLKSYYFSGGYQGDGGMLKFVTFSGKEQTYQAWNGVPEEKLETDRAYNSLTYDNETDNYQQDHYQLHYSKSLGSLFNLGGAFYLTNGSGYYEQYKANRKLSNYGISPVVIGSATISRSDLIQRKWLDNSLFGATYALNFTPTNPAITATVGGGWNKYDGDHFGEVIWARYASTSEIRQRYYDGNALKSDFNIYGKVNYQLPRNLGLFLDLQYRTIDYELTGTDDNQRDVTQRADFKFFNPKAGITLPISATQSFYASYAVGNREPVRSDFVDRKGAAEPKPETLYNTEIGYRFRSNSAENQNKYTLDANLYYMDYKNQLVLTGQLNDVGSPLRTNIKDSYRAGIELSGVAALTQILEVSSTVTLSRNKINNYNETVYEYDSDYTPTDILENQYQETDISFSPAVITAHKVEVQPLKGLKAAILYKTVSKQYLDNTASEDRKLKGYEVADLRMRYTLKPKFMRELEVGLLVYNVLNKKYEANGYTFSEQYTGDSTRYDYNYYYPQATRNYLLSLRTSF